MAEVLTQGSTTITVQEVRAERFRVNGCTVLTLTDGILVGKTKNKGSLVPFALSFLFVLRRWAETADPEQKEAARRILGGA